MVAFQAGGQVVQSNFLLGILASIMPLPVFLGIASLVIKGLRKAANIIARVLSHVFGEVSAFVGIRRIGKEASSAGPAIMVLVLAISLAWNGAVLDSSLPETYLIHSKFAMGSDVSFQLNDFREDRWDEFFENVTAHEMAEDATLVKEVTLYLTDDWNSRVVLVGITPDEYVQIGYDHLGQRLNETDMAPLLEELNVNMDGVIISADVATDYEVDVGDTIRAFNFDSPPSVFEFRVIGIVEAIPEQLDVEQNRDYYYWETGIGTRRAWIHSNRASDLLNASSEVEYFCAVRSRSGSNETALALDILENGGTQVLKDGKWGAVSIQVLAYVNQVTYHMDRATDTMLAVITLGMILGGFGVYAAEGLRARRREIALLRSMGAQRSLIVKAQGVELVVLTLLGLLVLLGYAPIFITTSLVSSQASYSQWASRFPISLFPIIPWIDLIVVLAFFSGAVLAFVLVIAALSSKVKVAMALNAAWAEAGPYGGDL
jgi:ABC-type lipoprotein release transport system permease subunit